MSKLYKKNEPVLDKTKSVFAKNNNSNKKQNSEVDNYFYQLPSIELFSRSDIRRGQTKETEKINQQLTIKQEKTLLEYGV